MSQKSAAYAGTVQDVGCDVFINHIMPIIRQASKQLDGGELAGLYAGLAAGLFGSMAADFGKDVAQRLVNKLAEQFGDVVQELDQGPLQ